MESAGPHPVGGRTKSKGSAEVGQARAQHTARGLPSGSSGARLEPRHGPWPWVGLGSHPPTGLPWQPKRDRARGFLAHSAGPRGPNSVTARPRGSTSGRGPRGIPRRTETTGGTRCYWVRARRPAGGKMGAPSPQCDFLHYPWWAPVRRPAPNGRSPSGPPPPTVRGRSRPPCPARHSSCSATTAEASSVWSGSRPRWVHSACR